LDKDFNNNSEIQIVMQSINSEDKLSVSIHHLEKERAEEGKKMKEQLHLAYESIQPANLVKSALKEAAGSKDLKYLILNTAVGMTAGYLAKKLITGDSSSPSRKLFGALVSLGVTLVIANNADAIKEYSNKFVDWIGGDTPTLEEEQNPYENTDSPQY
jgi:hypothetical protein